MKKLTFSLLLTAVSLSGFSQSSTDFKSESKYRPSFGFNVGLNQSVLFNSNATEELEIQNAPGFRLGVLLSFPIFEKWSIDPKAELSFNYSRIIEGNINYRVDPNNLDFMVHMKYDLGYWKGKIQPYCYLSPNIRVPLSGEEIDEPTYDTKIALAADFAFGLDIDLGHFNISPEIRFSGGLTDIRRNPYGNILRGSNAAFVLNFSSN
jgi:hypothetical protein